MCARRLEALAHCIRVCVRARARVGSIFSGGTMETPFFSPFGFNHCRIKVQCLTEKRSILPSLGAAAAVQALSSANVAAVVVVWIFE